MYETGTLKIKAGFDISSFTSMFGAQDPVSDFGIYTGGGAKNSSANIKADAVAQFHNNNTAAGAKMLSGGTSSGGSNNFIQNLSSKGGAMGATALGLPPEAGSLVGGVLGSFAQGSGKWVDDRPGQRDASGWGVKPSTYSSFAFTFNGENYVLKDWGTRKSYWNANDNTQFTGFAIYKNGKMIADHAKYVWQENGKLYMQNNLAPWDYNTAGKVMVYLGQPGKDWEQVGEGIDPNPKAFTGFTQANNTAPGSPSTPTAWNAPAQPNSVPTQNAVMSPANPSGQTQTPSGGFPIVGGEFDWRKYIPGYEDKEEPGNTNANKENTEKKDNTLYWVIGGVGLLIFIAVMVLAFKN